MKPSNNGVKRKTHAYPLAGITYCAHCDRLSKEQSDPSLRSTLGGTDTYGTLRYKHKRGIQCGCNNRSVRCEQFEDDFHRLLKLLTVPPEAVELMNQLALESSTGRNRIQDQSDLEAQKKKAIALCKRRIEAAKFMFLEGEITQDEFLQRKSQNEREIAHWQTFTSEKQKLALELAMCIETVDRISNSWLHADDEDKRGLVRSLFEEIVYDLDTRQIVDFKLKAWAENFIILRAKLYRESESDDSNTGSGKSANEGDTIFQEGNIVKGEASSVLEPRVATALRLLLRLFCFSYTKVKSSPKHLFIT